LGESAQEVKAYCACVSNGNGTIATILEASHKTTATLLESWQRSRSVFDGAAINTQSIAQNMATNQAGQLGR
jgi:hypothetical protein